MLPVTHELQTVIFGACLAIFSSKFEKTCTSLYALRSFISQGGCMQVLGHLVSLVENDNI